ncbi:MAG: hypothetical protein GX921_08770 [Bacteroidales bacterium]|nr:hypothetical protein [Bacteroidales bacterium]
MKLLLGLKKRLAALLITLYTIEGVFAQESSTIIDDEIGSIVIDKGPFYAQLWFWVVIGLVFLFLLIILIRGNGGKGKHKYKEEKEENTEE